MLTVLVQLKSAAVTATKKLFSYASRGRQSPRPEMRLAATPPRCGCKEILRGRALRCFLAVLYHMMCCIELHYIKLCWMIWNYMVLNYMVLSGIIWYNIMEKMLSICYYIF